jgi:hypothetical protein
VIAVDTSRMAPAVAASPGAGSVKSSGAQLVAVFPPRPVAASWPATGARRSAVLDRVLAAPSNASLAATDRDDHSFSIVIADAVFDECS